MPELADVEGFRRLLADRALDRPVRRVTVPDPELLEGTTPQGLGRALHGRRLTAANRHGKWLFAPTDDDAVLIWHFRMTGELRWGGAAGRHPHDRVGIAFDDGELCYREQRRLGRMWLVRGDQRVGDVTGTLGPDALDVDRDELGDVLAGTATVKARLMDQRRLAGIGNELSDEILWRARLHPARRGGELASAEIDRLNASMRAVLRDSARAGRIPEGPTWLDGQRGAADPRCPRCERPLRTGRVAGRTSYWCAACQPPNGRPS